MRVAAACLLLLLPLYGQDSAKEILSLKRVHVDRLTGGEAAAQMRDLIIASLHNSKLFVVTEDPERADAFLRGAADDLIYTDQFQSKDGVNMRAGVGTGTRSNSSTNLANRSLSVTVGDDESLSLSERKHEAMASVRLVNKAGDVIWSTTQESSGAKFRGASADVAEKITRQLLEDVAKARHFTALTPVLP
ncbi:MAG: hypothetical protein ABI811_19475 [Acidobacteriota bacterium]